MGDVPCLEQLGKQSLRGFADEEKLRLWVQLGDGFGQVILAVNEVLPAIGTNTGTIDIVWIPRPHWIETFGVKVQGSFQSWGIMETQVGPEPVNDPRLRHVA